MDDKIQFYVERVEYLEKSLGWYHFVLELVNSLGSIHGDAKSSRKEAHIFADSQKFIERVFPLSTCAGGAFKRTSSSRPRSDVPKKYSATPTIPTSKAASVSFPINVRESAPMPAAAAELARSGLP